MPQDAKYPADGTELNEPPKPEQLPVAAEPKPAPPPVLDITDEEWIAASQSCCGRKE
ncbi:hypothetical protein [Frigoriglobus tundricola]|uniref:Uncharacterized protein n=1 Tax=Frigoriglobus tundricola TaxID=2774151 RepID=A0A6M5YSV4_9BACT|nr:hypothetical protein [Frigoriglobus tundricola]QJW96939.1 hypothetical protein FTUN_4499 [Frigoriglobus tundricola]